MSIIHALVLASFLCSTTTSRLPRTVPGLDLEDLVVVLPSSSSRHALIVSSRTWRQGIRTFIPTNSSAQEAAQLTTEHAQHLETYVHVDDEVRENLTVKPCERVCYAAPCTCLQSWQVHGAA